MTTTTKPKPKPKTPNSSKKRSFSPEEFDQAIKSAFTHIKERMMIRPLWSTDSVHRFRVNWWGEACINSSKFVIVTEEDGKLTVKEIS